MPAKDRTGPSRAETRARFLRAVLALDRSGAGPGSVIARAAETRPADEPTPAPPAKADKREPDSAA